MDVNSLTIISNAPEFQRRVRYHMIQKALLVQSGAPSQSDNVLIQKILDGSEPLAPWCIAAVTGSTIAAGSYSLDGLTIPDSDLQAQVHAQWPAFLL